MNCHRGNVFDICFCPIIPRLNLIFAPVFMFEQRVGSVKIASLCFFLAVLLNRVIHLHMQQLVTESWRREYRAIIT